MDYTSVLLATAAANADRACNVPQSRKTPYSRVASAASMQLTAFGFRRRAAPDMAPAAPVSTSSYHCSPHHVPPTPPTEPKPKPSPVANRFGFQLGPRATAVLNNINAQIVTNNSPSRMDGNCNPVPHSHSHSTTTNANYEPAPKLEENNRSTLAVTATNPPAQVNKVNKSPQSLLPKPKEHKSRLPGPKATSSKTKQQQGLKQPSAGKKNGANIAKPVVAKPVVRPPNTKSAKTEANQMMVNQSSDSSPGSGKSQSSGIGTLSATDDSPTDLRERYELRAPTAISEDFDEEEREEKACIDENFSEKMPPAYPIPVWTETAADEVSSSGSYSEGIEEQQIEFPDNVTDKSGDSLISSISSTSSEPNGKQKKKKSGSSLSQLSNGSDDNFLIDDEIADQPGLTFDDNNYDDTDYIVDEGDCIDGEEEEETEAQFNKDDTTFMGEITLNGEEQTYNIEESVTNENENTPPQDLSTLVLDAPPSIQVGCEEGGREAQASPVRTFNSTPRRIRSNSTGTLSPCESITSDDLMLDFEDSVASRNVSISRLAEMGSGITGSEEIINKWNVMLGSVTSLNSIGCGGQPVAHQQTPPSLRSRASSNSEVGRQSYNSPLRPPRSSVSSIDGEWMAGQNILQDILSLKTGLLKLKRTLQDADVRNPFDSSLSISGMYYNLANSDGFDKEEHHVNGTAEEENVDLRRQVIFLKQQLTEKDRTISLLQQQMTKYSGVEGAPDNAAEKANVATQTERIRPVSMGSTMSHSTPVDGSGPLVSTSTENLKQEKLAFDGPKLQKPILALNNNDNVKSASNEMLLRTSSSSIPIPKSIPQRKVNL
ncbi:uncharacterized protein LOC132193155 isoform X2 [Neocloeon triangulifer]|uniref:uncharacterized protein LOC132193155 isoform X2 n=1 Tax=Neocloeon triangulifer TaxID=2078957 RepID=UPI00286F7E59|nr:uncharacterized protein LOC132193155 isoform X2 [Neocloeon triangulifer]